MQDAEDNWGDFEGVYGYYAVNEPKPGAVIYANFPTLRPNSVDGYPFIWPGSFGAAASFFRQAVRCGEFGRSMSNSSSSITPS